jgi:hypothetical protein
MSGVTLAGYSLLYEYQILVEVIGNDKHSSLLMCIINQARSLSIDWSLMGGSTHAENSLSSKYLTHVEVTGSEKHSSLLKYIIDKARDLSIEQRFISSCMDSLKPYMQIFDTG